MFSKGYSFCAALKPFLCLSVNYSPFCDVHNSDIPMVCVLIHVVKSVPTLSTLVANGCCMHTLLCSRALSLEWFNTSCTIGNT